MLNKIQMKKKHRRAVCFAILIIPSALTLIIGTVGDLCRWIANKVIDTADWLKTKLRVYDYDPD